MAQYTLKSLQIIAGQFGVSAEKGDVFLLYGDLGVGKTAFAQAFIQARYPDSVVTSPTFSICQEYQDIVHYDLYRIHTVEELYSLDIQEHFHNRICLIEWPERLQSLIPEKAMSIYIGFGAASDKRSICF